MEGELYFGFDVEGDEYFGLLEEEVEGEEYFGFEEDDGDEYFGLLDEGDEYFGFELEEDEDFELELDFDPEDFGDEYLPAANPTVCIASKPTIKHASTFRHIINYSFDF